MELFLFPCIAIEVGETDVTKYLLKRLLHGAVSIVVVVAVVMTLIYSLSNRDLVDRKSVV